MSRDEVARWVRTRRVPPLTKLILLLVFDRSGELEDGRWGTWPSLSTLAEDAGVGSVATVRKHLAALEESGLIEREARYTARGGQTSNRIVLLVTPHSDGSGPSGGGDRSRESAPPAPTGAGHSVEAPHEAPTGGTDGARAKQSPADVVPDDFPSELRPHAREVMRVLRDVAERRGARRVTARGVALSITPRRHKALVKAAHDCAAWIEDHPEVACRDVLARYRRWLDREPDLQGLERLDAAGVPTSTPRGAPAGVTPIRRSATGAAGLAERTAVRRARLEALGAQP